MRRPIACACVITLLTLAVAACGGAAGGDPDPAPPAGETGGAPNGGGGTTSPPAPPAPTNERITDGVVATFTQAGESFTVWFTDPVEAQLMWDIANGRATFTNVSGVIAAGSGYAAHNAPWSWSLDPRTTRLNKPVSNTLRYTGTPSQVEANVAALVAAGMVKVAGNGDTIRVSTVDLRGDVPTGPGELPEPR